MGRVVGRGGKDRLHFSFPHPPASNRPPVFCNDFLHFGLLSIGQERDLSCRTPGQMIQVEGKRRGISEMFHWKI